MCPSGLLAHRGPGNQTGRLVVRKGCNLYDFYSDFFDFFCIYYKVEGWEDTIRKLLFVWNFCIPNLVARTHLQHQRSERERRTMHSSCNNCLWTAGKSRETTLIWNGPRIRWLCRHLNGRCWWMRRGVFVSVLVWALVWGWIWVWVWVSVCMHMCICVCV